MDRGRCKGVLHTGRDITIQAEAQETLRHQARTLHERLYRDALTGLPTRHSQVEYIQTRIDAERPFSIIVVSLNHYSQIYGNFGWSISDQAVTIAALRMQKIVPPGCRIARTSEDRFAIVTRGRREDEEPVALSRRIMDGLREPLRIGKLSLFVNVSVGITRYPEDGDGADQLIRNSIAALAEARLAGGMSLREFTPSMEAFMRHMQWLDDNLHLAHDLSQFQLHFQPKVDLADGRVVGAEALIRWRHPERGDIPPDQFICRAEANGLIFPLGHWIIDAAARQAADWKALGCETRIAINISVKQLTDPDLLDRLAEAQDRAAGLLDIEITESCLMRTPDQAETMIQAFRRLGYGVHLDDFGTGYSSFERLVRLPFSLIKLDRIFVQGIDRGHRDRVLLKSMIVMAGALGIDTLAEGVETQAQADFLRREGVAWAQGWLYAPAMPADRFQAFGRPAPPS